MTVKSRKKREGEIRLGGDEMREQREGMQGQSNWVAQGRLVQAVLNDLDKSQDAVVGV